MQPKSLKFFIPFSLRIAFIIALFESLIIPSGKITSLASTSSFPLENKAILGYL
jgi:hypothetical protein